VSAFGMNAAPLVRRVLFLVATAAILALAITYGHSTPRLGPIHLTAGALRTWVSGVGDDANPCSRTAPCKTFQGAISKTASGGEIDTLDPGGFGGVTITQPITIDGLGGDKSSVLVSGTNAIVVASGATSVTLRHLELQGVGTGLSGVNVTVPTKLTLEDDVIENFTTDAVNFNPGGTSTLSIRNSSFLNNANGISVATTAGSVKASITDTHITSTTNGISAGNNAVVEVNDSVIEGGSGNGVACNASGSATCTLETAGDKLDHNGNAISATNSSGGHVTVTLSNDDVFSNNVGISDPGADGVIVKVLSFRDNRFVNNATDGQPTDRIRQV